MGPASKNKFRVSESGPRPSAPCGLLRLLTSLVLFLPTLIAGTVDGAGIKSVQRGSVTFTTGTNRMPVTLPTTIDPNKTIAWGGIVHGGGARQRIQPER